MKTKREQIKKLLYENIYKDNDIYVFYSKKAMDKFITDVAVLPLYPQDFVEFTSGIYFDGTRWYVTNHEPMNTNELYEYWTKNEKS